MPEMLDQRVTIAAPAAIEHRKPRSAHGSRNDCLMPALLTANRQLHDRQALALQGFLA